MCSTNEMFQKFMFLFLKIFTFLGFTEEMAFQHFRFINNTKFRFFSLCSDEADMKGEIVLKIMCDGHEGSLLL